MRTSLPLVVAITASCSGAIDGGATEPDSAEPAGPTGPERSVEIKGPAVLAHVQRFANSVCGATNACTISTYVGHDPSADRAIDILVSDGFGRLPSDGNALGDKVAEFALSQKTEDGIMYVIWRQRINLGGDWRAMEDRGGITKNHYDHVHVSFETTAP